MKIVCDDFWTTVHHGTYDNGNATELALGLNDGNVVTIALRPDGEFDMGTRRWTVDRSQTNESIDLCWSSGEPMLEMDSGTIAVITEDGTRLRVYSGENELCKVTVSDGTVIRTYVDGTTLYNANNDNGTETKTDRKYAETQNEPIGPEIRVDRKDAETKNEPKEIEIDDGRYLVCRRDLSGYEFVHDLRILPKMRDRPSVCLQLRRVIPESLDAPPATVVKTFTRSPVNENTANVVDKALASHFKTIKELADRLNASFPNADLYI